MLFVSRRGVSCVVVVLLILVVLLGLVIADEQLGTAGTFETYDIPLGGSGRTTWLVGTSLLLLILISFFLTSACIALLYSIYMLSVSQCQLFRATQAAGV